MKDYAISPFFSHEMKIMKNVLCIMTLTFAVQKISLKVCGLMLVHKLFISIHKSTDYAPVNMTD
jgi:hypothetical protein